MFEWVGEDNLRQWRVIVEYYPNATDKAKWYWEVREAGELLDAGHAEDHAWAVDEVSQTIGRFL